MLKKLDAITKLSIQHALLAQKCSIWFDLMLWLISTLQATHTAMQLVIVSISAIKVLSLKEGNQQVGLIGFVPTYLLLVLLA